MYRSRVDTYSLGGKASNERILYRELIQFLCSFTPLTFQIENNENCSVRACWSKTYNASSFALETKAI